MLVADFTTPRSLRAYARFDAERLAEAVASGKDRPEQLLGAGVLALTIDQGAYTQRYQGIVQLDGASLEDVARVYFRQSEQIPTDVRLSVAKQLTPGGDGVKEHWRAGGILAQFLPAAPERLALARPAGRRWRRRGRHESPAMPGSDRQFLAGIAGAAEDRRAGRAGRPERRRGAAALPAVPRAWRAGVRRRQGRRRLLLLARQGARHPRRLLGRRRSRTAPRTARIKVSCEFCSKAYEFDPAEFAQEAANRDSEWRRAYVMLQHRSYRYSLNSPSATCRGCPARRRECRSRKSRRARCASCSCRP